MRYQEYGVAQQTKTKTCASCRSLLGQLKDVRNRNRVQRERAGHFRRLFQREHALRLAAEQQVAELQERVGEPVEA